MANEKVTVGIIRRGSKKLEGESSFSLVSLTSRLPRLGEAKGREPKLKEDENGASDFRRYAGRTNSRAFSPTSTRSNTNAYPLTHSRITHSLADSLTQIPKSIHSFTLILNSIAHSHSLLTHMILNLLTHSPTHPLTHQFIHSLT